jgi:hypothetical protein
VSSVRMGLFDGIFGQKKGSDDAVLDRNFQAVSVCSSDLNFQNVK